MALLRKLLPQIRKSSRRAVIDLSLEAGSCAMPVRRTATSSRTTPPNSAPLVRGTKSLAPFLFSGVLTSSSGELTDIWDLRATGPRPPSLTGAGTRSLTLGVKMNIDPIIRERSYVRRDLTHLRERLTIEQNNAKHPQYYDQ